MNEKLAYMGREVEMLCGKESFQFLPKGSGVVGTADCFMLWQLLH